MGVIAKAIGSILGIGQSAPKANVQPALDEVDAEAQRNKNARSALLQTAGAGAGASLQPGQVGPGNNLFGN